MSNNGGAKLPQKKKNDLLKKFLNAQEYTKTLKKNAMSIVQDSNYGTHSYDQIQSYPEVPQSAKLPSTKYFFPQKRMYTNDLMFSMQSMNINESHDFSAKSKIKKSHGFNNMAQSSNQIPYIKSKKSSYSQIDKSQTIQRTITCDLPLPNKLKDFDVLSMKKGKNVNTAMYQSYGAIKTDNDFKLKAKKSFNYSNLQEFESEKMSAEDEHSFQKLRKTSKLHERPKPIYKQSQQFSPYNLSASNFIKLINKVEQLQAVISLYQQAIKELKNKILNLESQNQAHKMSQIYIDNIKEQLFEEKNKNAQLRDKISLQQNKIQQYQQTLIGSVQKIGSFYQKEISKITMLQKQNHFLKFMLRLQITNPNQNSINSHNLITQNQSTPKNSFEITKNLGEFKQKFMNLVDKNNLKTKS